MQVINVVLRLSAVACGLHILLSLIYCNTEEERKGFIPRTKFDKLSFNFKSPDSLK